MLEVSTPNQPIVDAVSIMEAAILAHCHVSTIYKSRPKLGAFKREENWYVPLDSLRAYIQKRASQARRILAVSNHEAGAMFAGVTPPNSGPKEEAK
jgi:hypothetical protein